MSSVPNDKNTSKDSDEQYDSQTREFINALAAGQFHLKDIDATAENNLHTVEATLTEVGQRNALEQYAGRYDFREISFDPDYDDSGDHARIIFRRRVSDDDRTPSRRTDSPMPVLPDMWSHNRDGGDDIISHDETGLTISIKKQYGRTGRHDDVRWQGRIRRGDGHGEPLTWNDSMTREAAYASAAKFAAGNPDGDYDPEKHLPESIADRDRPRWPDVLGYDDATADSREWTCTDGDA